MTHKSVQGNPSNLLQETREAYYWAGFLAADGGINHITWRLKFNLAATDRGQVIKFSNFIECPNVRTEKNTSVALAIQDKSSIPIFARKFDFKPRKKENPPTDITWMSDEMFIAFLIGFIDGDGTINHQSGGRRDSQIQIKLHSSWLNILKQMADRVSLITGLHIPPARINGYGYALLIFSNAEVLNWLKKQIFGLPVLIRKWDKIDETFVSKYTIARNHKPIIALLWKQGLTAKEIADKLQITTSKVYTQVWRQGITRKAL